MATRGFEFAYMLDGSHGTPVIRDFIMSTAAAHKVGDLLTIETDGDLTQETGSVGEATAICMEAATAAQITAGTTKLKCAILTRNQVWRCSMDASTSTAVQGYTKTLDVADTNTIDADDPDNGSMILLDKSLLDDDSYVLAYVVFADTTFGNT